MSRLSQKTRNDNPLPTRRQRRKPGQRRTFLASIMCCVALLWAETAGATTYSVGPGKPYTSIGAVPWYRLLPGDSVKIFYRSTPYREKFLISTRGTASEWIRVVGVPSATGQLPVISGNGATTSTNMHWRWQDPSELQLYGVVQIAAGPGDNAVPPAYIEIANLQIQDGYRDYSFTGENGTTIAYDDFCAGIYARSVNNLLIRNNIITNCGQGIFNWTASGPDIWWAGLAANTVIRGNHFYNNGVVGSYSEHQTYTESDGVTIEYNHYGPQRSGTLGSQIKDRSAGTIIRYNYIEQALLGYDIDLVEPENGWDALGVKDTYKQSFVYGNLLVNDGVSYEPDYIHWNEDHQEGKGRANGVGNKLLFYNNTLLTVADQSDMYGFHVFNTTYGGYDCAPGALPGTIDARNNIFALFPRTAGGTLPFFRFAFCDNTNLAFGNNWCTPGWTTGSLATITGTATMVSPASNNPGFVSLAAHDLHLLATSTAVGIGGPLAPEVTTNYLGLNLTPTQQYVYHQKGTSRSSVGAGSAAGALGRPAPLPVSLVAFTAQRRGPTTVALAWRTAQESRSAGFAMEKAPDGLRWQQLAFVAGAGTSSTPQTYAYTDAAAPAAAYYRLRQLDLDGASAFSPPQFVPAPEATDLARLVGVFPNPVDKLLNVELPASADEHTTVRLFDALGRAVPVHLMRRSPQSIAIATAGLAEAQYVLQIDTPQGVVRKTVLVCRP